ncbi:MAG: SRPBCC family protein [Acidobacteria bacterium]|nr:SRPBCC family protein [Acidobacteriota bacterium]
MTRNIADWERWASIAVGMGLTLLPRGRRGAMITAARLVGAGLVFRGATGHSPAYHQANINRRSDDTRRALGGSAGVNVTAQVTINRPVSEVYGFWRNFENLSGVMTHLESVEVSGHNRSRWTARGPAGTSVSWEAETINEVPNVLIAWRSLENADVVSAGSVNFREAPAGQGTEVRVSLQYSPPAGKLGAAVAWLFGEAAEQQIRDDLRNLKRHLEMSDINRAADQPSGSVPRNEVPSLR